MATSVALLEADLLENSYNQIKPNADSFAASFYKNLFTMYPQTQPLFANVNMQTQQQMLWSALTLIVRNLRKPELFKQTLQSLGCRHLRYGAAKEHYPLVKEALLKTFQDYLQEEWTPEMRKAWIQAYDAIAEIMLQGN